MSVTVNITVEDIATQILTYDQYRVYRANSLTGAYAVVATEDLDADEFHYAYVDSAGDINKWYKYTLYNAVGPVESDLSAPFRPGNTSLLRIRQKALSTYAAGAVFSAVEGAVTEVLTDDYRYKHGNLGSGHGKGSWLHPVSGNQSGLTRQVTNSDPSAGSFTISPDWPAGLGNGDEVEWHWLARPDQWDEAIRAGLNRYWYIDTIPIRGVESEDEYDLSGLPWLRNKRNVKNVKVRWGGTGLEEIFGTMGRWWKVREDLSALTLQIQPTVTDNDVLYIEVLRTMPLLWTDTDQPPRRCSEELAAALGYDEVLNLLQRPNESTKLDRADLAAERRRHQSDLYRMLNQERSTPSYSPPQLPEAGTVPIPWKAR